MRICVFLLSFIVIFNLTCKANAFELKKKDAREREAEYVHKVLKEEEKEKYDRKKYNYKPSGYMTVDEYEALSTYKNKTEDKIEIPKVKKSSDMKYVPQPTYRIVRYNDPPGSPELNITKKFFKLRQYNGQGITAPDFSIMVYPVVYYYPNSASTASDLFVIKLEEDGTPLSKILRANVVKRIPEPIVSTDKSIDNSAAFRTLTPIDFSADSSKLLLKEKIGSSLDGIWQTNAIVYDFETKTSYNLVEVRDAIIYYWKENKGLNLDDVRWDIYPLGFMKNEPDRIAVCAYAYTGKAPVFLGIWSVDSHGEQSRLISFDISDVEISINGFKIVQDGVVKPVILENEEKAQKKLEEKQAKDEKKKEEAYYKQLDKECKQKLKQMDTEFRETRKDYIKQRSIGGTTTFNEAPAQFKEIKIKQLTKEIKKDEKQLQKDLKYLKKLDKELKKIQSSN